MKGLLSHRLFWPCLALILLLLANLLVAPGFFSIQMQGGHLYGSLIDILRNGSPVILVALGMTLVIATRGIDLSVGAVVAIAGAVACTFLAASSTPSGVWTVLIAVLMALGVAAVLGAWNGMLVATFGIQPIIATLILMTAGRGIAMLITDGQIITVRSSSYKVIGAGYWLTVPVSIIIVAVVFAVTAVLTRRTALGMLIESVGVNPEASRLAGVRSGTIIWTVYVFCALCAAVAGLMISSDVTAADANNAGLFIEMDAILAVVIGGTSLAGGRFSLVGTLIGALIIQSLRTTVLSMGITPETTLVFKALVVAAVCLLQSEVVRRKISQRRISRRRRSRWRGGNGSDSIGQITPATTDPGPSSAAGSGSDPAGMADTAKAALR